MTELDRLREENRILRFTRDAVVSAINSIHDILTGERTDDEKLPEIVNFGLEVTDIGDEVIESGDFASFWDRAESQNELRSMRV